MNIDTNKLIKETEMLGNSIYSGISKDRLVREFSVLMSFNGILRNLEGLYYNPQIIIEKYPDLPKMIKNDISKSLQTFYEKVINEAHIYRSLFANHIITYNEEEMNKFLFHSNYRGYSAKDAKDILLSYFSQYGNRPYNIVKRYMDEKRIQMGYDYKDTPAIAFFTGSALLENGYVCLTHDKFNTSALSYLSHEFGHVIDKEYYYNPQQKKIKVYNDLFNEVPSSFFDWGMLDYLIENKIDEKGALSIKIWHYYQMLYRNIFLFKLLDTELFQSEDIDVNEDFRTLFLYGVGYHISLAMNELAREDREEYMKYYNNFICSRNEADFISLLEIANIDVVDFINCDILQRNREETVRQLQKIYKI